MKIPRECISHVGLYYEDTIKFRLSIQVYPQQMPSKLFCEAYKGSDDGVVVETKDEINLLEFGVLTKSDAIDLWATLSAIIKEQEEKEQNEREEFITKFFEKVEDLSSLDNGH